MKSKSRNHSEEALTERRAWGRRKKKACDKSFEKLGHESEGERTSGKATANQENIIRLERDARMSGRQCDIR